MKSSTQGPPCALEGPNGDDKTNHAQATGVKERGKSLLLVTVLEEDHRVVLEAEHQTLPFSPIFMPPSEIPAF